MKKVGGSKPSWDAHKFFYKQRSVPSHKKSCFSIEEGERSPMIIVKSHEKAKISSTFWAQSLFKYYNKKMIGDLSHIIIAKITA